MNKVKDDSVLEDNSGCSPLRANKNGCDMYCMRNMSRAHGVGVCLHGCLTWTIIRLVGVVHCVLCDYALKTNHVGGLIRRESGAAPLMSHDADYSDLLHPQTL